MHSNKWTKLLRYPDNSRPNTFQGAVYSKSQRKIILFGGYTNDFEDDLTHLIEYLLDTKKWKIIPNVSLNIYHIDRLSTMDEKYLIVTGAFDKDDEEIGDRLYILNMDDYTLRMNKIKLSENE